MNPTSFRKSLSNDFICNFYNSHSGIPSVVKNRQRDETHDKEVEDVSNYKFIFSCPVVPLGIPVHLPERINNGHDPLKELVHQKQKWSIYRNRLLDANLVNPLHNIDHSNSDRTCLPIGVVKLADHLDRDPDPYFVGKYNWYYTDGNLKTIDRSNSKILALTRYSVPGVIVLQSVRLDEKRKESLCLLGSEASLHTGSTQPIFQITSYNNIVASRQKNTSCLFSIESDGSYGGEMCHKYESIANLTSLSIAPNITLHGEYCTLDTSNNLKIWVPFWKNVKKSEGNIVEFSSKDNWGNVKYLSENTVLLANRDLICLKDVRYKLSKNNGQSWKKNHINSCEVICNTVLSEQVDKRCYVATTHQLLELDFRKSYMKRWTHMLDSPPSLGMLVKSTEGEEIVALGSQSPGEVCCVLTNDNSIPYHLPSPNDTLNKCRLEAICLDPSVTSRCNLSLSGLDSYYSVGNIFMIRQTSVGDLFCQRIDSNSNSCALDFHTKSFQTWEKQCAQKYDSVSSCALIISNEIDCGTLFNSISKRALKSEKLDKEKLSKKSPWNISKKILLESKNSFLECLLDVWEIEDEPEWSDPSRDEQVTAISSDQSGSKVSVGSTICLDLMMTFKNINADIFCQCDVNINFNLLSRMILEKIL
ncbi:uncharacterized protein LOC111058024 [Nilaparvata lugens]|uniref:uncharacterized protein LOC111058024 n=1 Tax=Nilaparvata lugens TaxID=108931 RepID=UPI00193C9C6A|nr:uncharacterized protein LOC111058024 [Nilaparvata lugens]